MAGRRRPPPIRVKVWENGRLLEKVHPPDGEHEKWWRRLSTALGTVSSDFTNQCLFQIQAAARSPFGGISELAINAALAMIEAAAPKDEIEGALAVQMACTRMAAMAVLARLDNSEPCLLATRGQPLRLAMHVHQVVLAPVAEHSRKPDEVRQRIQRLLAGPYLELYARQPVDGWTTLGDEILSEAAE